MFNYNKILVLSGLLIITSACQSTPGKYTLLSQSELPQSNDYSDKKEYLVRLALHLVPRVCKVYTGFYSSHSGLLGKSPNKESFLTFHLWEIRKNLMRADDEWYSVYMGIDTTVGGGHTRPTIGTVYMNTSNPKISVCGKKAFNKKYLNTGSVGWLEGDVIISEEEIAKLAGY